MATYIVFFAYTEEGIRNVKDSPARVEAARKIFHEMGAEVQAHRMTRRRSLRAQVYSVDGTQKGKIRHADYHLLRAARKIEPPDLSLQLRLTGIPALYGVPALLRGE